MKQCFKCGQVIPDNAKFCSACGEVMNPVPNPVQGTVTYEQEALEKLDKGLKWEAICYRVVGIATIVLVVLSLLLGTVFAVVSHAVVDGTADYIVENYNYNGDTDFYYSDKNGTEFYYEDFGENAADAAQVAFGIAGVVFWVVMIFSSVVSIAYAVINLVAAGRVTKHRKALYTDCRGACDHATSVGVIIFAVFFNLIALIPIIINNVHVADKKTTFDLIKQRQAMSTTQNV